MQATLRPAIPADAPALALLGAATFLESYAPTLPGAAILAHCAAHHTGPAWHALLATPGVHCTLAVAPQGAPVAYVLLTAPDIPGQLPNDQEIRRLYVLSAWQGRGLGAALLRHARTHASAQGASRLILGVYTENPTARAFYARTGFTQVATRLFTVGTLACNDLVLAQEL